MRLDLNLCARCGRTSSLVRALANARGGSFAVAYCPFCTDPREAVLAVGGTPLGTDLRPIAGSPLPEPSAVVTALPAVDLAPPSTSTGDPHVHLPIAYTDDVLRNARIYKCSCGARGTIAGDDLTEWLNHPASSDPNVRWEGP